MRTFIRRLICLLKGFRGRLGRLVRGDRQAWQSDVARRLLSLEIAKVQSNRSALAFVTERELVRMSARLKALEGGAFLYATKTELSAAMTAAAGSVESLRLLHEEESNDAGSHRSFIERELDRSSHHADLHRKRMEAAFEAVVERLSEVESILAAAPEPNSGRITTEGLAASFRRFDQNTSSKADADAP